MKAIGSEWPAALSCETSNNAQQRTPGSATQASQCRDCRPTGLHCKGQSSEEWLAALPLGGHAYSSSALRAMVGMRGPAVAELREWHRLWASAFSPANATHTQPNHQTDHQHQEHPFNPCSVRWLALQRALTRCPHAGDHPDSASALVSPKRVQAQISLSGCRTGKTHRRLDSIVVLNGGWGRN